MGLEIDKIQFELIISEVSSEGENNVRVHVFEFILVQGLARDQLRDAEVRVPPPVPRDVPL